MKARLVFWDESGLSERPFVCRTWSPKGQTPVIQTNGSWKSCSLTGAIACTPKGERPRLFLRMKPGSVKSGEVIRSLKELRRHQRGRVILIWDGLPAHRSKAVRHYLESQSSWLSVERLPAYAPELNPVEYLWSCLKRKDVGNAQVETLSGLKPLLRRHRQRLSRRPDILTGFLRASGLFQRDS